VYLSSTSTVSVTGSYEQVAPSSAENDFAALAAPMERGSDKRCVCVNRGQFAVE
jgi:hypothetical protein